MVMSLIYVTGVAGTGKTTVRNEILRRGYKAYDADEDRISACVDESGAAAPMPDNPQDLLSHCPDGYQYQFVPSRIEGLIDKSKNKTIFLCGAAANDNDYLDSFSKVFALQLSEEALKERIQNRSSNDYGKNLRQLRSILEWHRTAEADYRDIGAILIDASQNVDDVVDEILANAHQ